MLSSWAICKSNEPSSCSLVEHFTHLEYLSSKARTSSMQSSSSSKTTFHLINAGTNALVPAVEPFKCTLMPSGVSWPSSCGWPWEPGAQDEL